MSQLGGTAKYFITRVSALFRMKHFLKVLVCGLGTFPLRRSRCRVKHMQAQGSLCCGFCEFHPGHQTQRRETEHPKVFGRPSRLFWPQSASLALVTSIWVQVMVNGLQV